MAAPGNVVDYDLKDRQNQFKIVHDTVQKLLDEGQVVVLNLDIDGVQDYPRLLAQDVIRTLLEENESFKEYVKDIMLQITSLVRDKFLSPHPGDINEPLFAELDNVDALVKHILEGELSLKEFKEKVKGLENDGEARKHRYYLSYCGLLKSLVRGKEKGLSVEKIRAEILANTAQICAMHLSTAMCAHLPLTVADKSKNALSQLVKLYETFQNQGKDKSYVIQVTSRTEAMATTFCNSLNETLSAENIKVCSLEAQGLNYNYNQKRFPTYKTGAIAASHMIAASRNPKEEVVHQLLQDSGLLAQCKPLYIVSVDDTLEAHEGMKKLPNLPGAEDIQVVTLLFHPNREKSALCRQVAANLRAQLLSELIKEYKITCLKADDPAGTAVMTHYLPALYEKEIITQDRIIEALESVKPQEIDQDKLTQPLEIKSEPVIWGEGNTQTVFQLGNTASVEPTPGSGHSRPQPF